MALFYQGLAQLGAEQAGGGPRVSELEYDGIPVSCMRDTSESVVTLTLTYVCVTRARLY
jgi:hypothetical protein